MSFRIAFTALLVRYASLSSPAGNDQDALPLLLGAAAVSNTSENAPANLGSDNLGEVDRDASEVPPDGGDEGRAATKRRRISGQPRQDHAPSGRGRGTQLRNPAAIAERERKIREYLIANPHQGGPALMRGLNTHLGEFYGKSSLKRWVREVRLSLGHSVAGGRLTPAHARRRDEIVDEHVTRNPGMHITRLAELIEEQLVAEGIPRPAARATTVSCINASRRRLNARTKVCSTANSAERKELIDGFVRDHFEMPVVSMIEPLRQLLQGREFGDPTDSALSDAIYRSKRRVLSRAFEESQSTTTEIPEGAGETVGSAPLKLLPRRVPKGKDLESALHAGTEQAAFMRKICDFMMAANPELRGSELVSQLNSHLGTSVSKNTMRKWMRKAREEHCPSVALPMGAGNSIHRGRKQFIDEYVSANPTLSEEEMMEPLAVLLMAERIPFRSHLWLQKSIHRSWVRLGKTGRHSKSKLAGVRKVIIEAFIHEHIGWEPARMIEPLQQQLDARNLTISRSTILKSIHRIMKEATIGTTIGPDVATGLRRIASTARRRAALKRNRLADSTDEDEDDDSDYDSDDDSDSDSDDDDDDAYDSGEEEEEDEEVDVVTLEDAVGAESIDLAGGMLSVDPGANTNLVDYHWAVATTVDEELDFPVAQVASV